MAALQDLQSLLSHTQASLEGALPHPWLLCLWAAGSASRQSWGSPPRAQWGKGRLQQQGIRQRSVSKASQVPSLCIRDFA